MQTAKRNRDFDVTAYDSYDKINLQNICRNEEKEMLFICYPKCTTCKKAKKYLEDNGISYTERDIKEQNPTFDELKHWYEKSGLPLKRFFNTSGVLYKSMQLASKLSEMSEEEQLRLLATDGMLVKRPIAVTDDAVYVGFRENEWAALSGKEND